VYDITDVRRRLDFSRFVATRAPGARGIIVGDHEAANNLVAASKGIDVRLVEPRTRPNDTPADGDLDFVYLAGDVRYEAVRTEIERWYPLLRPRGVMAGDGYLDGQFRGRNYGVKSAVDELARAEGLQVRVTLDDLPTWFFVKEDRRRAAPRKIAVVTAYDEKHKPLAEVSLPNKAAYCARHGYDFIERTDGFDARRPLSWSKIKFVREVLPGYDWVFWSDVDSLVMEPAVRLEEFADEEADLVLCHEDFGVGVYNVNCGQMLFKNSDWSRRFLDDVWRQTRFIHDRLWEQRAVIHLLWKSDLSDHVHLVTQRRFNSYLCNYAKGDFLLHLADMPDEKRLEIMRRIVTPAGRG